MALQVNNSTLEDAPKAAPAVALEVVGSSKRDALQQDVLQQDLSLSAGKTELSVGNKRLARLGPSPVLTTAAPAAPAVTTATPAAPAVASTTPTTSTTDVTKASTTQATSGSSSSDEIFALLLTVASNLCNMEAVTAQSLSYTSEMSQKSADVAVQNQQQTTDQINKSEKQQHRQKIIGRFVKAVAITIVVVAVLTGQPELAPLSTLLMTALTTIMIADPKLITEGLVTPLSKGLQSLGVPETAADLMAKVFVVTLLAVATAGVGAAADGAYLAEGATNLAASLGKTVSTETVDYAHVFVGNFCLALGQGVGVTQPFNDLFSLMLPNNPKVAEILGTTFDLIASISLMIAGGVSLKSSNLLSGAVANEGSTFARYGQNAKVGLQALQPIFSFMSGLIDLAQAKTTVALAKAQASNVLSQNSVQNTNALSQMSQNQLQQIATLMEQLTQTAQSFTRPGETALQNMRG